MCWDFGEHSIKSIDQYVENWHTVLKEICIICPLIRSSLSTLQYCFIITSVEVFFFKFFQIYPMPCFMLLKIEFKKIY